MSTFYSRFPSSSGGGGSGITSINGDTTPGQTIAAGGGVTVASFGGTTTISASSSALTNAHIFVGNGSNIATDVAMSGDIHITNAGVTSIVATSNATLTTLSALALTSAHIFVGNGSNIATDHAISGDITLSNTGVTALVATSNATLTTLSALTTASSLASIGTITTGVWHGTAIDVTHGGTGTTTQFTAGSVVFAGASGVYSQDNSKFFYDATNHRLGIGTATPGYPLEVNAGTGLFPVSFSGSSIGAGPAYFTFRNSGGVPGDDVVLALSPASIAGAGSCYFAGVAESFQNFGFAMRPLGAGLGVISNAFYLKSTGGLGLGNNSPQAQLHVLPLANNVTNSIGIIVQGSVSQALDLQEWQDNSTNILAKVDAAGNISQAIGATTSLMTSIGVANVQTSAAGVGNSANTADDTLFTYTLPINAMSANGKSIRIRGSGTFSANANLKEVKIFFAGTAIVDSTAAAVNGKNWAIEAELTRIDATHVSTVGTFTYNSNATEIVNVTPNLVVSDLTANTSIIKITGASTVTGAANDVLGYMMKTWFEN